MTAKRSNKPLGFGRSARFYDLPDGSSLPSVTTILSAINKPALVNWSAKVEREAILKAAAELWQDIPWPDAKAPAPKMSVMAYLATLSDRVGTEKANVKLKNKAGDIGSEIHALVEWEMRKELKQEVGPQPKVCEAATWGAMAHEDWRKKINMVPIFIEQTVWSVKHGYAGTLDILVEMDLPNGGRGRVLIDNKSGKAIYSEAALQVSAYAEAIIEMGHAEHPLAGCVVRVPKVTTDPEFETKFYTPQELAKHFKAFLATLELWKWLNANDAL